MTTDRKPLTLTINININHNSTARCPEKNHSEGAININSDTGSFNISVILNNLESRTSIQTTHKTDDCHKNNDDHDAATLVEVCKQIPSSNSNKKRRVMDRNASDYTIYII